MKSKLLIGASIKVAGVTFAIKILGFIKQIIIAYVYGVSDETDVFFYVTSVFVNLGTIIFSAISVVLLTQYIREQNENGSFAANSLIDSAIKTFVPIAFFITALFEIFAPQIVDILAPNFTGINQSMMVSYIRWMSVFFVLCCYYLIINVVAESNKRFLVAKGYAFFQNTFLIVAALFSIVIRSTFLLVLAFLLAAIVQCFVSTYAVRDCYHVHLSTSINKGKIKQLFFAGFPLFVGNAIYEINDIVDKRIATGISSGSVSVLHYGASLNEIVVSVVTTSIATVLFAHIAEWIVKDEKEKVNETVGNTIEVLSVLLLPVTAFVIIEKNVIVTIIYGYGKFDLQAVNQTAAVLACYAIGFIFQAYRAILVKIFYAHQDTKTPMINGAFAVALNILLSVYLSKIWGVGAIALATSISMCVVSVLLAIQVRKYLQGFRLSYHFQEIIKATVSTVIVSIIIFVLADKLVFPDICKLFFSGICTFVCYFLSMSLMKSRNTGRIVDIIKKK